MLKGGVEMEIREDGSQASLLVGCSDVLCVGLALPPVLFHVVLASGAEAGLLCQVPVAHGCRESVGLGVQET